jgi:hypothetical protein
MIPFAASDPVSVSPPACCPIFTILQIKSAAGGSMGLRSLRFIAAAINLIHTSLSAHPQKIRCYLLTASIASGII